MEVQEDLLDVVFEVINKIKKTNFCSESIEPDSFLGGELGIDSVEMLEVWYDLEKKFDVKIHDYAKRDIYTVADVVKVLSNILDEK